MVRDGYLATADVSRYFFEFPWAESMRALFSFIFLGSLFEYLKLCFGFTSCPYYCSTWSAECYQWFKHGGIEAAFLMDDWMVGAAEYKEAERKITYICDTIQSVGFTMAKEKGKIGQKIVWLGILIDTLKMTIRIEAVQARGFLLQLNEYSRMLEENRSIDLNLLRHLAGKLNWFSEVVQSGRLHIHGLWDYISQHPKLPPATLIRVSSDIRWWKNKLKSWGDDEDAGGEYPILNGIELLTHEGWIEILQSDTSGVDGFGYIWHSLDKEQKEAYQWYSAQWGVNPPTQSHEAELRALHHFITRRVHRSKLLVWVTDSESGCWTINKGHCKDPKAHILLEEIFQECERITLQIIALWVPREQNQLTDYLSHFATLMNREEIEGSSFECSGKSSLRED